MNSIEIGRELAMLLTSVRCLHPDSRAKRARGGRVNDHFSASEATDRSWVDSMRTLENLTAHCIAVHARSF